MSAEPAAEATLPLRPWQRRTVWTCWLVGGFARLVYLLVVHPATAHVYSDMHGYVSRAQAFADGGTETIADTLYPPGTSLLFGLLYRLDRGWALAVLVQWLLSLAVMRLVWLIARRVYGGTAAVVALLLATLYFPFVHYASFFLSENPFTVCVLACIAALLAAAQARSHAVTVVAALGAGIAAGCAMALKNTILGPLALLAAVCTLHALRVADRRWLALAAAAGVGLALVLVPLAERCTRLNEQRFCLSANNLGMNVLMGHFGRVRDFVWIDAARNTTFGFTAVESTIRDYQGVVDLQFGAYDSARNLQLARDWISAHPLEALGLSLHNVVSLFAAPSLWPPARFGAIDPGAWSQRLFWPLILLPALVQLARRARAMASLGREGLAEWLLVVPLLGVAASVFVAISEARFRVPFDGLLIVLASGAWSALGERLAAGLSRSAAA